MASQHLDVRYVAELARLELTPEEIDAYQGQLERILEFMKQLDAIDVSGIEPMAHANPVYDVFRDDEPGPVFTQEQALRNAPRSRDDQFVVPKVVE